MSCLLLVEDNRTIAKLIIRRVHSDLELEIVHAKTYQEVQTVLEERSGDFFSALLDLNLPDAEEGEIVDLVLGYNIPSIVFTGVLSDKVRELVWSKNVVDYVVKESIGNVDYVLSLVRRLDRNPGIKVLVVDDSNVVRKHLNKLLNIHRYDVFEATDGIEALKIIEEHPDIKLVITDFNMPKIDGFELTKRIRSNYTLDRLAIIGISSQGDSKLSSHFIKSGANDFIAKPFTNEEFYCRITQNIEMLEYIEHIRKLSNTDYLTGLYNRRFFFEEARYRFDKLKKYGGNCAIVMIDIDKFKGINDNYGHDTGDEVLKFMANILKECFNRDGVVARFGGEEFCIMVQDFSRAEVYKKVETFRKKISSSNINAGETSFSFTISAGICTAIPDTLDEMLIKADELLYKAKETGRNKVICE